MLDETASHRGARARGIAEREAAAHDAADDTLHAAFERIAAEHASRIAILSETWQPSYAELNATANRLAHRLIARGDAPGDRVALLMAHDSPAFAAVLASLKAGRIGVILNAGNPPVRLRQLLDDAQPTCIVTDAANAALAKEIAGTRIAVLLFEESAAAGEAGNPASAVEPGDTAFLVYTSGSTGSPKAVMKTHRQLLRSEEILSDAMELAPGDRMALLGSLAHGQAITMMWSALLKGAVLCPFPVMVRGITGLADWMVANGITAYISSASIFRNFMQTLAPDFVFDRVHTVRLASEAATSEDVKLYRRHFPPVCKLVHTLASSEAGNIAVHQLRYDDAVAEGRLPIGTLSDGQDVLFLDENGQPVAPGEVGEIVIRSRFIAAGYWGNPELTAEKFTELGGGLRMFRTGDLGRINAEGALEFFGRKDARVKIRGNRISLTEVEDGIRQVPGIAQVAVDVVERATHEPMLVAYVVAAPGQSWSPVRLRKAVRTILPDQMVPSAFLLLDELPLMPSGKLDRVKLREIGSAREHKPADPPQTETEAALAKLWADVFEVPAVGRKDDFFELGGDSLIAAVVSARVHAAFGVELELRTFADCPSLLELAGAIDDLRTHADGSAVVLEPVPREGPLPISLFQDYAFRGSRTPSGTVKLVLASSYRIVGPLDRGILQACLTELAARHESLRTSFVLRDAEAVQVIHPPQEVALPFHDLVGHPDPEAEARRLLHHERVQIRDIGRLPLMRWALARVRADEHWLLRAAHHMIIDAWSTESYLRELGQLYEAKLHGLPSPLPEVETLQYADYAAWQRKAMRRGVPSYDRALAWWKATLAGTPLVMRLPFERPQEVEAPPHAPMFWGLDPEVSRRLNALGMAESATYYAVRLAIFAALLSATTGYRKLIVGADVTNRHRAGMQAMFGFLVNFVMLSFRFEPELSFRAWVSVVKKRVLESAAYGEIPFRKLRHDLLRMGVLPRAIGSLFTVFRHRIEMEFGGLRLSRLDRFFEGLPSAWSLRLDEHNEASNCETLFDTRVYDPDGVRAFIESYQRLADAVSREPDRPLRELFAASGIVAQPRPGWAVTAGTAYRRLRRRLRTVSGGRPRS